MKDGDFDDVLKRAADSSGAPDPALLARIAASLGDSIAPVRPVAPLWMLAALAAIACAAVGVIGALVLGPHGIEAMNARQAGVILPALVALIVAAAAASAGAMIPGSRRLLSPVWLLGACCLILAGAFFFVFDDYRAEDFWSQGLTCLKAGLVHAVAAAALVWLALRRGFAVNSTAAAIAQGTLAGLAGVTMLELHCPNFEVVHVVTWHIGVVVVSAGAAALFGRWKR